jgi:predicted ATPase
LVLDDLHWADDSSLLLLQFLAREIRTVPALVIGTYRDNEIDSEHPLTATLSELARAEHSERLVLAGLAHVEIARFIELSDDRPFPSGIVETIARETEGNPFFVTQIVRLLHAEGWPQLTDTPDTWNLAVPQSVRAVIGRRLKRLSPECNRTLTAAAVIGRVFGLAVLSRVRELPGDDVLEYLSEAEAAQVITRVPSTLGQFTFIHALVRETLYEGLGSADRARLHRKTGVALEGLYGSRSDAHISELAHHFAQGAPSGAVAKGAAYAVRAAEHATRMLAYEEAVRHYQTALRVLALEERDDASRRLDLLLALGEAQNRIGAWDLAREAFREAAELANSIDRPEQFARAALGSGAVGSIPGVADKQLVHQLETALALVGASDSRLRVGLLGRLAMELIYTDEGARRNNLSRDAIEMARRLNEPIALAQALDSMHVAMKGPENLDERLVIASEIVQLAENAGANELALQGRT